MWRRTRRDEDMREADPPTLDAVRASIPYQADLADRTGWLAALDLIDLSQALRRDVAQWTTWSIQGFHSTADDAPGPEWPSPGYRPFAIVDWVHWTKDVTVRGRDWTPAQACLAQLAMGLVLDRPVQVHALRDLGDLDARALRILVEWVSGEPPLLTVEPAAARPTDP